MSGLAYAYSFDNILLTVNQSAQETERTFLLID